MRVWGAGGGGCGAMAAGAAALGRTVFGAPHVRAGPSARAGAADAKYKIPSYLLFSLSLPYIPIDYSLSLCW